MKNLLLFCCLLFTGKTLAQESWSEEDRQYLLSNLDRTTDELKAEVDDLTETQWHFKEKPDSWSIAQVIEHLGIYEKKYYDERYVVGLMPPEPELSKSHPADSYYVEWMAEEQAHNAPASDVPLGLMKGKNNWTYFITGRNRNVEKIKSTEVNFNAHYTYRGNGKRWNIHQLYIILFAHCDRHLRQIRRIKAHPDFPRAGRSMDEEKELAAIMKVIEAETDCFYRRDYECWKEQWVQEEHAFQAWSNADGSFDARTGWQAVDKEIADYIKTHPVYPKESSHPSVIRKNMIAKFYGENVAYLSWDQYNEKREGKLFIHSKENRIMEKHDGAWKIAHVSAFWDYQNQLTETELR